MTVKELIEELKKYPGDARVLVEGYENGYDDARHALVGNFVKKKRPQWWDGDYDHAQDADGAGDFVGLVIKASK